MTDIVKEQLRRKLPKELIRLLAEIRAAGFEPGVNIDKDGRVSPTKRAVKKRPSHQRVLKRYGSLTKWLKALNQRYSAWARTYRP